MRRRSSSLNTNVARHKLQRHNAHKASLDASLKDNSHWRCIERCATLDAVHSMRYMQFKVQGDDKKKSV